MLAQDTPRPQHPSSMGGTARTLAYQYDRDGNRITVTHPDGVSFAYAYDGLDRPYLMAAPGYSLAFTSYTPAGLPDGTSRGNGELSIYAWDGVQRLNTLTHIFPVAPAAANVQWQLARNPAGQIAATTRINDSYAWTGSYTVNRGYTANGLNQYSAAGSASFTYDANGNLTSDGSTAYAYDIENRLVSASGAHSVALAYDPLGRLWQVTSGTATTRFLYDGDALVAEYDGGGNMTHRYAHWVGADVPVVAYAGAILSQPSYLHADNEGSIVALSDASGAVTAIDTYDEYGIPGAGNTGRFQYTGQVWLAELGLYYYKARIYSPTLGRFMQTDPIGYDDQFNLYEYVGDDPVNDTDPSGECGGACVGALIGAGLEIVNQATNSEDRAAWGRAWGDLRQGNISGALSDGGQQLARLTVAAGAGAAGGSAIVVVDRVIATTAQRVVGSAIVGAVESGTNAATANVVSGRPARQGVVGAMSAGAAGGAMGRALGAVVERRAFNAGAMRASSNLTPGSRSLATHDARQAAAAARSRTVTAVTVGSTLASQGASHRRTNEPQ